jgi:hypothetical protein
VTANCSPAINGPQQLPKALPPQGHAAAGSGDDDWRPKPRGVTGAGGMAVAEGHHSDVPQTQGLSRGEWGPDDCLA